MSKRYRYLGIAALAVFVAGCGFKLADLGPVLFPSPVPPPTTQPPATPAPATPTPGPIVTPPPATPTPGPIVTPPPAPPVVTPPPPPAAAVCAAIPAGYIAAPGYNAELQIPKPGKCYAPVKADSAITFTDCWTCSDLRAYNVRQGHWIDERRPDGLLRANGIGSADGDKYVTRQCDLVWADTLALFSSWDSGRLGNVCPREVLPVVVVSPPPASPAASPGNTRIPESCPALIRWGGGVHAQRTPSFEGIPKNPVFAGNYITNDSTARFGANAGGRGNPCNDEHHNLCTVDGDAHVHTPGPDGLCTSYRRCEDPRGPVWRVLQGDSRCKTEAAGWQLTCGPMQPGLHVIEICPRPDVQDHHGRPVTVLGNACFQFEVNPE